MWQNITMDFIKGLPISYGKKVILVVVDRLSKAAYFMVLSYPYTTADVAQSFMDNIFKLHGLPDSISDRDCFFKPILEGVHKFTETTNLIVYCISPSDKWPI